MTMSDSMQKKSGGGERLVKFLAAAGLCSRRKAGDLVKSGAVACNGTTELDPSRKIGPADQVTVNGEPVAPPPAFRYILLHKPRGYVCTNADPHASRKAVELIGVPERLFSAGRLDKDSEGLLLFSNDGDYVAQLTHPRHEILKEYEVSTSPPLSAGALQRIRSGIRDDGELLSVRSVSELRPGHYRFVLNEGKKREIRRLVAAVGSSTLRLKRVACGGLKLGNLKCGAWRELSAEEVALTLLPGEAIRR